jgi:hypothetical protein
MRDKGLPRALAPLAMALGILCACSSARHQNVDHPNYGDLEYRTDLAECRKLHSTVVSIQGYDVQSQVTTDEAKVATCMTEHGWQTVSQ